MVSPAQSRNVLRNPCTVTGTSMRLRTAPKLISDNIPPLGALKIISLASPCGIPLSNSITRGGRGIRCSFLAFIRSDGTVHSAFSRLISCQVAPRTSPERVAVSIVNSSAFAATPERLRKSTIKMPTCEYGRALWCLTFLVLLGAGSTISKLPFHRAGFSPSRYP